VLGAPDARSGHQEVLLAGDALADKAFASITGPAGDRHAVHAAPEPPHTSRRKAIVERSRPDTSNPKANPISTPRRDLWVWSGRGESQNPPTPSKSWKRITAGAWDYGYRQEGVRRPRWRTFKQIDYVVYKWAAPGKTIPRSYRRVS